MTDLEIYRKRLERIEGLLSELSEHSERGAVIIVEGKRDILSMKRLGIEGNFELATRHPLFNFSERIAKLGCEVIILTDWDRRGDLLAVKLSEYFGNFGIKPELQIRKKLKLITQKEIKDVESLYTYVSKLRSKTGSSLDPEYET
ncbi:MULTISPECIES: toprim domain-containing protein [unclassified Methanosarcina]|uniref:toprim domain-containing protein n=1 Tax=unclassified Methanosarcina TaxID=2644672 RepID=UPI000615DF49|nr:MULTISPECIES: toprim domain-containing protein [unclassified Methanosarcina]AKB17439.1 Small primase-like proteins (Toprim domain) [Methanosarcina sp. WWM596]AKB20832.1 Small primase-like proteins (Toprim domain) [Methanosarcina sp. WH1]